jgi:hypothetical protein
MSRFVGVAHIRNTRGGVHLLIFRHKIVLAALLIGNLLADWYDQPVKLTGLIIIDQNENAINEIVINILVVINA